MDKSILHGCIDFLSDYDSVNPCSTLQNDIDKWVEDSEDIFEVSVPPNEIDTGFYINGVHEALIDFLSRASSKTWKERSMQDRRNYVDNLISSIQIQQRTVAWYEQSKTVLTASEFSAILGSPRSIDNLALQKVAPINPRSNLACSTVSMSAFDWGIRFEPVVKQILEVVWGSTIAEVGRFLHAENTRLAASPDGIILTAADPSRVGRLVEIKCPVRREINGVVPFDYWCQMQIQMEVTNIDECEYVEMKIMSAYKDAPYIEPTEDLGKMYSGKIWLFQAPETYELKYAYTALERKDLELLGWNFLEEIPWHLEKMRTEIVARDRNWYESTKEKQENFWLRVEAARQGLVDPPKKRPRLPSVQICQITDDAA